MPNHNKATERAPRQPGRATLRFVGVAALAGSLFCGWESGSHFCKATGSIHDIQALEHQIEVRSKDDTPPQHDALQQLILETAETTQKRIALVGDETAMRNYGIGFLALGTIGLGGLAINRRLDALA
jgi:hypothetical protein